jgi:serine protease
MKRLVIALAMLCIVSTQASAKVVKKPKKIEDQYLVQFRPEFRGDAATSLATELAELHQGSILHVFDVLGGMEIALKHDSQAEELAGDPRVLQVEETGAGRLSVTQMNAPWHLDRVDDAVGLDGTFGYCSYGSNVLAYVVDTGVRGTHKEFWLTATNSTSRVETGFEAVSVWPGTANNPCPARTDCPVEYFRGVSQRESCAAPGHGTAVASVIGGLTFGGAKMATIVPVRIAGCNPQSLSEGNIAAGLNWIASTHPTRGRPGVVNMSMEMDVYFDTPQTLVEGYVQTLLDLAIPVVVAAGNRNQDARLASPARLAWGNGGRVISVGGSTPDDKRWICQQDPGDDCDSAVVAGSNWGAAVDIFAPARNVRSASISAPNASSSTGWLQSDTAERPYATSGTSFAAPLVTARVARIQQGSGTGLQLDHIWWRILDDASIMNSPPAAPLNGSPARLIFHPRGFSSGCT